MAATIRYVPERELPPYTYVPGRAPHPVNDPAGHAHGIRRGTADDGAELKGEVGTARNGGPGRLREFLWGIDLFNRGYYWEAHEAWESVWNAAGRRGPIAGFVQGLIKLAAAGVKVREGRPAGVRRHTARAKELITTAISRLAPTEIAVLGMDPDAALSLCDEIAAATEHDLPADSVPRPIIKRRLELISR